MSVTWTQGQPSPAIPGPYIETAVDPVETAALAELAAGRDVLEIGSAYGHSAIAMALADARVLTVDPHAGENADSFDVMSRNIAAYRVEGRVIPVLGYSQTVLPMLLEAGAMFDVVFLDGDHHAGAVTHDVPFCWDLVRPGGYLACHDYGQSIWPGVKQVLDEVFPSGPDRVERTLWITHKLAL